MYSLIIQNQKTTDSFHEHHPLFMEALEQGRVGYCRWIESGTSIDTAVPELRELTNDKEAWRAIIIRMVDEGGMEEYESSTYNPYDFKVNILAEDENRGQLESQIPLIRLTHMLGGVPSPDITFEQHNEAEEGKLPRTYYTAHYDEELQRKHRELQEKYEFDGRLPSEIWLITMRTRVKNDLVKQARKVWETRNDFDSSEFWRRNRYPAMCRFMVYDYELLGPVQKTADIFNFWMSVLLLATNEIEPSALQGYRLYDVHTDFNKKSMEWTFQSNANKLMGIRRDIMERRQRERDGRMHHNRKLAHLDVKIDLVQLPSTSGAGVDPAAFKTYARTEREERSSWRQMSAAALGEMHRLVKNAEKRLNERAEIMRARNTVSREEVRALDRFEMEDFQEKLSKYYDGILIKQKQLPDTTVEETREEKEAYDDISADIDHRLDNSRVLNTAYILDAIILLMALPVIVFYGFQRDIARASQIFFIALCFMLVLMCGMHVFFLLNRHSLRKKIKAYNELLNDRLRVIKDNEQAYTDFVNDIVSYSRGSNYLRFLKEKNLVDESVYQIFEKHLHAVDVYSDRLERWSRAYFLNLSFREDVEYSMIIDATVPPIHNVAYTFEVGGEYEVPLNGTGENIISPFEFVEKLTIRREELYDDARGDD